MQNQYNVGVISENTGLLECMELQKLVEQRLVQMQCLGIDSVFSQLFRCVFIIFVACLLACSFSSSAVVGEERRAISGPYC